MTSYKYTYEIVYKYVKTDSIDSDSVVDAMRLIKEKFDYLNIEIVSAVTDGFVLTKIEKE
jgi:hypothetical protein